MRQLIERELVNMTQTALAKKLHVSQATIYKILYSDTVLTVDTLQKISHYFSIPINKLIDDQDGEPIQDINSVSLATDEQQMLSLFRQIRLSGASQEALNFLSYLVEKNRVRKKAKK